MANIESHLSQMTSDYCRSPFVMAMLRADQIHLKDKENSKNIWKFFYHNELLKSSKIETIIAGLEIIFNDFS